MRPLSHALFLVLKLACFEAKHGQSKTITKDHLFLGLLKVVDVDVEDYVSQLSKPEQQSTREEIVELRNALCILDTTYTRRALRKLLGPNTTPDAAMKANPVASAGYADALEKIGSEVLPGACLCLLRILLESPGKGTDTQLKSEGAKAEIILESLTAAVAFRAPGSLAHCLLELHRQWGRQCQGKHPDLGDYWRRLAAGAFVEFDPSHGLKLIQANYCLVHIPANCGDQRAIIFGEALAKAFSEFESGSGSKPCRVPLAEF